MNTKTEISIIIPVYNEEKRIIPCLKRILSYCSEKKWDVELIVAEDGSTDNTKSIVNNFRSNDNRINLLTFKNRLGKGGAIRNAIFHASKDYICFLDVDLSADIDEVNRLISYIDKFDMVIGSRILRGNLPPIKAPTYRKIPSRFYSRLFRFLFQIPIHDPQCGLKLFKKNIARRVFSELHITGFAFDSEVIVKAYSLDLQIKEVPIIWNYDYATKISIPSAIREMGKDLMSIWYETYLLWLKNRPISRQKHKTWKTRILFGILSLFMRGRK